MKYGSKDGMLHDIWQDPYGLYTTLFVGIDLEHRIFVGADPVLHSPTKFFISIEFKQRNVDEIVRSGWAAWERDRASDQTPVEVLVGGRPENFLRFIRVERAALGEDQGHRALLAENLRALTPVLADDRSPVDLLNPTIHVLAQEFELSESEVLDLVAGARRLKMAVRGWVAEEHLFRSLRTVPGITDCARLDIEGAPDLQLRFEESRLLSVECKNVLRRPTARGLARVDFQRTRASKRDPCSRYYSPDDFDVIAACLHARTERWEFAFVLPRRLEAHTKCPSKLASNVQVDERWQRDVITVLREATRA